MFAPTVPSAEEVAILGGGCFWGIEDALRSLPGVIDTEVGYAGGSTDAPTYEQVCSGGTGHAEVVRVTFDPARLPYRALLQTFLQLHDPTTLDRQGPDIGSQYRSVIIVQSPKQRQEAEAYLEELRAAKTFGDRHIVTQILDACPFTRAEEYHQQYVARRGFSSCRFR